MLYSQEHEDSRLALQCVSGPENPSSTCVGIRTRRFAPQPVPGRAFEQLLNFNYVIKGATICTSGQLGKLEVRQDPSSASQTDLRAQHPPWIS